MIRSEGRRWWLPRAERRCTDPDGSSQPRGNRPQSTSTGSAQQQPGGQSGQSGQQGSTRIERTSFPIALGAVGSSDRRIDRGRYLDTSIDARQYGTRAEGDRPARGLLHPARPGTAVGRGGRPHGLGAPSVGRPRATPDRESAGRNRGGLCLRAHPGAWRVAADGEPPPSRAVGGGTARARTAGTLGVLPAPARAAPAGGGRARTSGDGVGAFLTPLGNQRCAATWTASERLPNGRA